MDQVSWRVHTKWLFVAKENVKTFSPGSQVKITSELIPGYPDETGDSRWTCEYLARSIILVA